VHRRPICAAGHGGQILISQTTHALLEDQEEELPGASQRPRPAAAQGLRPPDPDLPARRAGLQESVSAAADRSSTRPFEGDEGRLADAARRALPASEREIRRCVRVLIADDQALVRPGFRMILEAEEDLEVVGEAPTAARRVDEVRGCGPTSS
jgi:hypothetical protein